jgi:hypothetical protein
MARWTPFRTLVVGLLATVGLAGCSLIPDQALGDIFGLDGAQATLDQVVGGAALSAAQFTSCEGVDGTHCALLATTEPFADPDLPGIVANIIAGLSVDAGLEATIDVTMDGVAAPPEQVSVTAFALSLTLRDVETNATASFAGEVTATPAVTFEALAGTPGRYVASDVDPLSLTIAVDGSTMSTVSDILTGGGDNTAAGVVVLTVAEPDIATIDVTLTSQGTTASF